eukprot:UN24417
MFFNVFFYGHTVGSQTIAPSAADHSSYRRLRRHY